MMGDDIYANEDVAACAEKTDWALLVQELPEMHRAGRIVLGADGNIADVIESSKEDEVRMEPGIASTNLYMLDTRLFSCALVPKHEGSLEYGLPQTVVAAARELKVPFEPVFTEKWIQITTPRDLITAAERVKNLNK
jgi:NDP-sugar pyrophosphorylase family protein